MAARRLAQLVLLVGMTLITALSLHSSAPIARAAGGSITTDKSSYQIGDSIRVCYTVPGPGPITITDAQSGSSHVVFSGVDDGAGGCLGGSITPPTGQECMTLSYQGGSAQACFQVVGNSVPPPPPQCCTNQPPPPGPNTTPAARFYGSVRSGGGASIQNASVSASIGGLQCGFGQSDNSGNYFVDVQATSGCATPGATVVFTVNGQNANNNGTLPSVQGSAVLLNLTVGSAPPPPPPLPGVSVTVDRGNGATYRIGDPVTICFSVNSSAANATAVATLTETQPGLNQTDFSGSVPLNQQQCANGTVTPPAGTDTITVTATVTTGGQMQQASASTTAVIVPQTQTCSNGSTIPQGQPCPPPPPPPCSPSITSVSPIQPQQTQAITIQGSCFGTQSPYNGNSPDIEIEDTTSNWRAGWQNDPKGSNQVTLNVTSWTDQQIVLSGFSGAWGQPNTDTGSGAWTLAGGDSVTVRVWNAQSGNGPVSYSLNVPQPSSQPPTVSLSCNPMTLNVGDTTACTATATSNTLGATAQAPVINAADGNIAVTASSVVSLAASAPSNSVTATQSFTFSSSGSHAVTANATDSAGQSGSQGTTVTVQPGGVWVSPTNGDTVTGTIHFAAQAYPTSTGGPGIGYVDFTVWWPGLGPRDGPWYRPEACHVTLPTTVYGGGASGNEFYECDWNPSSENVENVPFGHLLVSFDVSDSAGNINYSPNGEQTVNYSSAAIPAGTDALVAPFAAGVKLSVGHGYNDPLRDEPCPIGEPPPNRDHCQNQKYGFDLFPDPSTPWDLSILSPVAGVVKYADGPCIGIEAADGYNVQLCHFASFAPGVAQGTSVCPGLKLGNTQNGVNWVHINLDDRDVDGSFPYPLPFVGVHTLEGQAFPPGPDSKPDQHDGDPAFTSSNTPVSSCGS